jgi:tRNA nucleotidyltransferase (CCA-adding enzyme)
MLLRRFAELPAAMPLLGRLDGVSGVYLVGGALRDLALGQSPLDLDLVVDGELEPVTELLGSPIRSHDRFETCTVVLNGFSYDFARSRVESYAHPGALPTVGPATIDEDLRRRDFSVNAIALGLGGADRGRLVAVEGALEDLDGRRLRVLHDASFTDDPTRLLRLARYAARLGFAVEPHTGALAAAAVAGGALDTVSGSRIGAELRLLAAEPDPVGALGKLAEWGIDAAIDDGFGIRIPERAQLAARALSLLPPDGDPGTVALAAASLGIERPRLMALLDRLAFTAGQRDTIVAAAGRAQGLADELRDAAVPSQIAAAARGAPPELVALAGALGAEEPARRWLQQLRSVSLEIDGQDLLDAGMEPGPELGAALARALAAKLDGQTAGRADELATALGGAELERG